MKRKIPRINPREPLTKKARAAVEAYARVRAAGRGGSPTLSGIVGYALQAERMSRADLYAWLMEHNYRWNARRGVWLPGKPKVVKPAKKPTAAQPVSRPAQPATVDYDRLPEAQLLEMIRSGVVPVGPRRER